MNRKSILIKLIDDRFDGNQAAFARAVGMASAQVNQWVHGYRNLGDAGAHKIELKLGLDQGFFDMPAAQKQRGLSKSTNAISEKVELPAEVLETIELLGNLQEHSNSESIIKSLNVLIRAIAHPKKLKLAVETKDFAGKPPKATKTSGKVKDAKKPVPNKIGD
jgi:hypothetical protein